MYQISIIQKAFSEQIHKARVKILKQMVQACFISKSLTVTNLGRALSSSTTERDGIKKADRFLSNENMYEDYPTICKLLITNLIQEKSYPWILVDWTKSPHNDFQVLRAGLVGNGRAITLYEEVHPEGKLGNAKVHKKFLHKLQTLLPAECKPIIITDAGFGVPWFKAVINLAWDYVGRVRGNKYYTCDGEEWLKIQNFQSKKPYATQYKGSILFTKKSKFKTDLYVTKEKKKGRHALNKKGNVRKDTSSKEKSKAANEPLCLVTSLSNQSNTPNQVVTIYKTRMQIEEAFRDLKSTAYGFGLEHTLSYKPKRILILLMIAMLAFFIAYITGRIAEQKKLHLQFQASSIKHKRILSFVYLGRRIIERYLQGRLPFKLDMLECKSANTLEMLGILA